MKEYTAEILVDEEYALGESPFYDKRSDILSWVDITNQSFYRYNNGKIKCFRFSEQIGSALPAKVVGDYYLFAKNGIYLLHEDKTSLVLGLNEYFDENLRCNDCKADPMGRIFFGSSNCVDGAEDKGNLYAILDNQVRIMQPNTKISNGMAWNKNRDKFYFSDSPEHAVFEYDYDVATGMISNRRVLFEIKDGVSDGMTIDDEDNLYVAIWGGSRVEKRSSKDGSLLAVIHTGTPNTTSCCFYKEKLVITSSGGAVYICDVGAKNDDELTPCEINL